MKIAEFNKKSKSQLEKLLQDRKEQLRKLRFDLSSGKLKNVRKVQLLKKDIARILTILNKQES